MLEEADVRKIMQGVRAILNADQSTSGVIADRWQGGRG